MLLLVILQNKNINVSIFSKSCCFWRSVVAMSLSCKLDICVSPVTDLFYLCSEIEKKLHSVSAKGPDVSYTCFWAYSWTTKWEMCAIVVLLSRAINLLPTPSKVRQNATFLPFLFSFLFFLFPPFLIRYGFTNIQVTSKDSKRDHGISVVGYLIKTYSLLLINLYAWEFKCNLNAQILIEIFYHASYL